MSVAVTTTVVEGVKVVATKLVVLVVVYEVTVAGVAWRLQADDRIAVGYLVRTSGVDKVRF